MLDSIKEDIIARCSESNARAYIRLNKRNYKTIAMAYAEETLKKARLREQFGNTYNEINSVIGRYPEGLKNDKTWLVDIDDNAPDSDIVKKVKSIIARCEPFDSAAENSKVVAVIPTQSGTHLITKPFNMQKFAELKKIEMNTASEIAVLKDNPTLLYIP